MKTLFSVGQESVLAVCGLKYVTQVAINERDGKITIEQEVKYNNM